MSKFANILKVAGGIGAVVLAGILLGWLVIRNPSVPSAGPGGPPSPGAASNTSASAVSTSPNPMAAAARLAPADGLGVQEPATLNVLTNWEDSIDEILTAEASESDKA